jgi:hypothetical protein
LFGQPLQQCCRIHTPRPPICLPRLLAANPSAKCFILGTPMEDSTLSLTRMRTSFSIPVHSNPSGLGHQHSEIKERF